MNSTRHHWKIDQPGPLNGVVIGLLTKKQFDDLSDGQVLYSILGERMVKWTHEFDFEERFGLIAFGLPIEPIPAPVDPRLAAIDKRFTYHAPKHDQPVRYDVLRSELKNLARLIIRNTPESREQSVALTKLEEVGFWANASIARNE